MTCNAGTAFAITATSVGAAFALPRLLLMLNRAIDLQGLKRKAADRIAATSLSKIGFYAAIACRRSRAGDLPVWQQFLELGYLWSAKGIRPGDYYGAGLCRRGITFSDKCDFVFGQDYYELIRRINPQEFKFVAMNKIVTHGVLSSHGIPTTPFYGLIDRANGQTFDGHPLCACRDLDALIRRTGAREMCFKLVGGWGGKGFTRVSIEESEDSFDVLMHPSNTRTGLAEFWDRALNSGHGPAYFCEAVIHQHEGTAIFHPESVNTIRVWTFQSEPGCWTIFSAVFRMGTNRSVVDNEAKGGITCRIDPVTGALDAAVDLESERNPLTHHPTTGVRMDGAVLPMWNESKTLCQKTCRAFPYFRFLAVDLAISCEGPIITEIECEPSAVHQITFDRGARTLLHRLGECRPIDWRGN